MEDGIYFCQNQRHSHEIFVQMPLTVIVAGVSSSLIQIQFPLGNINGRPVKIFFFFFNNFGSVVAV